MILRNFWKFRAGVLGLVIVLGVSAAAIFADSAVLRSFVAVTIFADRAVFRPLVAPGEWPGRPPKLDFGH